MHSMPGWSHRLLALSDLDQVLRTGDDRRIVAELEFQYWVTTGRGTRRPFLGSADRRRTLGRDRRRALLGLGDAWSLLVCAALSAGSDPGLRPWSAWLSRGRRLRCLRRSLGAGRVPGS